MEERKQMMKKSAILNLLIAGILAFNTGGIQKAAQVEEIEETNQIYIPVIGKAQFPFWQVVKSGVEKAARDYNVYAIFQAPETEEPHHINTQLNLLKSALANHPKAIVLAALEPRFVTPYLEQARDEGIPVIGFDSGVDSLIARTTVTTDNYGAGELAADQMAQLIGGAGKVGIIVPNQTSKNLMDRRDGFINTIREKYPNIELLPVLDSQGDDKRARELMRIFIAENPELHGIFGANESVSEAIIQVVKELNQEGEVEIVGFDSGRILLDAIREGIVAGAVTQNPANMGYMSIEAAIRAYHGERLPEFIDSGFAWYDRYNMDTPEIRSMLYE